MRKSIFIKGAHYLRLMRLHQPTGIWLLLWPCWWSIAMASPGAMPNLQLLGLFAIGAIVMRGAGCVINDIIDHRIDAQVERTKLRPIASGVISVSNALWFLLVLLIMGMAILFSLNRAAIFLGLCVFLLVLIYPFMKRWIPWPQLFLGITLNSGALIGWAAERGQLDPPAFALYIAGFFWTLGYDTIYAHQDKKDDERIGVKSSAVSLKDRTKSFVTFFYLIMIVAFAYAGNLSELRIIYYNSLIIALLHLLWQVKRVKLDDPASCMRVFRSNAGFGWIIFLGIVLQKLL